MISPTISLGSTWCVGELWGPKNFLEQIGKTKFPQRFRLDYISRVSTMRELARYKNSIIIIRY